MDTERQIFKHLPTSFHNVDPITSNKWSWMCGPSAWVIVTRREKRFRISLVSHIRCDLTEASSIHAFEQLSLLRRSNAETFFWESLGLSASMCETCRKKDRS